MPLAELRCTGSSHCRQCSWPILANSSRTWSVISVMVPTVERAFFTGLLWSMAMAGGMPSTCSTCGLSMRSRNCRA